MRVVTLNLNGIRSAWSKGVEDWLHATDPDVVCLQETRIQDHQLDDAMRTPAGLHGHWLHAEKPGYSGVAILSKRPPDRLREGLGIDDFDREARVLQADYGRTSVLSLYLPSGSASEERQAFKYRFMAAFEERLRSLRASRRHVLVCGDWNIAHKEIDLKNWRGNRKNSGFLPEERAWMDRLFGEHGWTDVFRSVEPGPDHYTWWSNRGQAWAKNVGWRIDYQVATPGLARKARRVEIYKEQRFSDHAPFSVDFDHPC